MRADVQAVIADELEYQRVTKGTDENTSFGDFSTYMRTRLAKLDEALSQGDFLTAQDYLRKVTALGVAAMIRHGAKPRVDLEIKH